MKALRGPNRAAPRPADRMGLFQQTVDAVRLSLTVPQWNRLQEIILQDTGLPSIEHPDVADKLGLSQEQRDRVNEIAKEYRRGLLVSDRAQLRPEVLRIRQQKEQADIFEILTADQRKQWETIQGVKVDPRILNRPGVSPVGN